MNIFIIEDETVAAQRLQEMVQQLMPYARIVGLADSIEESVEFLSTHSMPNLILMDIELVDGQSFEIFKEVEVTCPVIFTTAYDEFALQAFKVHSLDYLLKPIVFDELKRSLEKFSQLQKVYAPSRTINVDELLQELRRTTVSGPVTHREHFLVKQGQRLISISVEEIAYFYSQERISFLKTSDNRVYSMEYSLEEIEGQIDANRFFRVSRQYLAERRSIGNVYVHFNGKYKIVLKPASEDDVYVSRDRAPEFKRWLGG